MNNRRQVVLDTETTGISHETGHRLIEIGGLELVDRKLTGRNFHVYINPEREVEEGAFKVHGISTEFLLDKPKFIDIIADLIGFIDKSELIIHNAPFDVGFLNAELLRAKWQKKIHDYCTIYDTLVVARQKHPGQRNSLDALCNRYSINNAHRTLHGALLDAEILASVYLAMTGGQGVLFEMELGNKSAVAQNVDMVFEALSSNSPIIDSSAEEREQHQKFVEFLVKKSGINRFETENIT